jgi:hypothetical protein
VEAAPSRVSIVKALMADRGLSPERGKAIVDAVAAGSPHCLTFAERSAADAFVARVRALGAVAEVSEPAAPQPVGPPHERPVVTARAEPPVDPSSGFELEERDEPSR